MKTSNKLILGFVLTFFLAAIAVHGLLYNEYHKGHFVTADQMTRERFTRIPLPTPRVISFEGTIWVDDRDFQIVKSHGKPAYMKEKKLEGHLFPAFTTYREQIDGKYWFPTYSRADEVLHFPPSRGNPIANDVHIRITVKYQDYKRFASRTKIIYGSEVPDNQQPPPQHNGAKSVRPWEPLMAAGQLEIEAIALAS